MPREAVYELASTCFFIAGVARSLNGDHGRLLIMFAQSGQLFHRHVAAGDSPLIILLQHERPDEPDDGFAVGEDTDDIGAPLDLLVDPFQRDGAVQLRRKQSSPRH